LKNLIQPLLLHIDDNEDDLVLIADALRRGVIPFRLRQFDDLSAARSYLLGEGDFAARGLHPLPSAVLLDLQFASGDTSDALPELRKIPGCNQLPWIILSDTSSPAKIAEAYGAGADCFLLKPFGTEPLAIILQTIYDCVSAGSRISLLLEALAEYQPFPLLGETAH
jgi:CheY-like chemotaxis protein